MSEHEKLVVDLINGDDPGVERMLSYWQEVDRGARPKPEIVAALTALSCAQPSSVNAIVAFLRYVESVYGKVSLPSVSNPVNIVGTGGGLSTFNISTTSAFVAAACGAQVLKSGSRAYASRSGALDVLEALGFRVMTRHEDIDQMVSETGIGFVPESCYPAICRRLALSCMPMNFKTVGQFINRLGPLLCPFDLAGQVTGASTLALMKTLAEAAAQVGLGNILFSHSSLGVDEILSMGTNHFTWLDESGCQTNWSVNALSDGCQGGDFCNLVGADARANAELIKNVLKGQGPIERLETVAMNVGATLMVAGIVDDISKGRELALEAMGTGKAIEAFINARDYSLEIAQGVVC
ncbi:anthranilate phosphoribosyltransferase [Motiliproteus sp. MSK22-1]|uniref:anthranilate phosphoribosyltransferase n=1 Tax=Motiliproteus sp. MSK22-1 TaxID=1897630 RepID=UPI000977C232|nr:hypothetical protein [Motiliproteus sp. MSK22-1]OMH29136.1 hypothetical protein BGP75_20515 [Motiliproteus sp. MSK22-1]